MCNFFQVWIIEISRKAFPISGSVSGSRSKAVFGYPLRLQTHYPAGYPTGKPDTDHLCQAQLAAFNHLDA